MDIRALVAELALGGDSYPQQVELTIRMRGKEVVPLLIESLSAGNPAIAHRAAVILGWLRDESAIPALAAYAKKDGYKSEAAIGSLGMIGGPLATDHLIEALAQAPAENRAILPALAAIGDNRSVEPIAAVLLDVGRDVPARCEAARALARFTDPRARAAVEKAIDRDPDWRVYFVAKEALAKIGTSRIGLEPATDYQKELIQKIHKTPTPPEGIERALEQIQRDPRPRAAIISAGNFLPQAEIDKAHRDLLAEARFGMAERIVEELMKGYLGNVKAPKEIAKRFIVEVGPAAIPALRNGLKRGDRYLAADCEACLGTILARHGDVKVPAQPPIALPPIR
jgi:HEAT repeat protein